jgi:hypothetical protein
VFALGQDGTIKAWGDDGTPAGVLFTVTKPEKADWWYCALGIEPVSGDLLVGSYWPDSKVYRFTTKGKPVTEDWPKELQCDGIYMAAGAPWGLTPGGDGRALQPVARGIPSAVEGTSWTGYPTGVTVATGAQMWIACAQGLVSLNRKGRPTGKRIGGLGDPGIVAAGPDGTVLVLVENSQRFVRMSADDTPGDAFASNANEPWRVANGWGGRAVGCAWDGKGYVTLDAGGSKALWRFDPDHTAFAETPWTRIGKEKAFADPRGLAVGDACSWVLDGASLLEFGPGDWNAAPKTAALPADIDAKAIVALCAAGDDRLYFATKTQIIAFDRDGGGWKAAWQSPERFEDIAGICAAPNQVIVADRGTAPKVLALDPADGKSGRTLIPVGQVDDFEPRGVAYAAGYVFVSDAKGHRVLRVAAGG